MCSLLLKDLNFNFYSVSRTDIADCSCFFNSDFDLQIRRSPVSVNMEVGTGASSYDNSSLISTTSRELACNPMTLENIRVVSYTLVSPTFKCFFLLTESLLFLIFSYQIPQATHL